MDKIPLVVATLCVLLMGTFADQEPILKAIPESGTLRAFEGKTAFIECIIRAGKPYPTIAWRKQGTSKIIGTESVLRFSAVRFEDKGKYTCTATNRVASKSQMFIVKVYGLQEVYGFLGERSVLKNTQLIVRYMTWYKDLYLQGGSEDRSTIVAKQFSGEAIVTPGFEYEMRTGNLVILNTALSHEANYTLVASNLFKKAWSYNVLHVYVKPSSVRMIDFPSHVNEDTPVSVSCIVDQVKPVNVTFTWMLASNMQSDTIHTETAILNSNGTFRITSTLTKSFFRRDDQQSLRCDVRHGVDATLTSYAQNKIVVYYKYQTKAVAADSNQHAVEGQSVELLCEVVDAGNPAVIAHKWYKNNIEIQDTTDGKISGATTANLQLNQLRTSDDGIYGCRIENGAGLGVQAEMYTLEVFYIPRVTITGPMTVDEEEHTVLTCSVDAKPGVKLGGMQWFLNDVMLSQSDSQNLTLQYILSAKRTDRGLYKCTVTNDIGTGSATHNLDVRYPPTGQPVVKCNATVMRVESTQTLTCNNKTLTDPGNPPYTEFAWRQNGQDLEATDAALQVTPALVTDGGNYACAVRNIIGVSTYSTAITLSVEAPVKIEGNTSHVLHQPRFDNPAFSISYMVSGGQNLNVTLSNSSKIVSTADFKMNIEETHGSFQYGQQTAKRVKFIWQTEGKSLASCNHVRYFDGSYSFKASGSVASVPSSNTAVFRIKVKYPAMWNGTSQSESSPMEVNKVLVCDVCANPSPFAYKWSFGGGALPKGIIQDGAIINITNVDSHHFGSYNCTASNILDGQVHKRTFAIELVERGSPHKPLNFFIISQTSETLLVRWEVAFNGGFDLTGFDLEYRKATAPGNDDTNAGWQMSIDKMIGCQNVGQVCEMRIMGLVPDTIYRLRIRAQNSRPDIKHYSDYVPSEGKTKALPPIKFADTKITKTSLTVSWWFEEQNKKRNPSSESRQKRSTSADDYISLEILYKQALQLHYQRFPRSESERIPASALRAVVTGSFDVTKAYDVIVFIYEGPYKIRSAPNDVSTHLAGPRAVQSVSAQTGIIAGVVAVVVIVLLIIVVVAITVHRRKSTNRSDVELRRKAVVGYQPVTNTVSTESLPFHPHNPILPDPVVHTEVPHPPMARPIPKPRNAPQTPCNGQKENPYVNVQKGAVDPQQPDSRSLYENVPKLPRYENISFPPVCQPLPPPKHQHEDLYDEVSRNQGAPPGRNTNDQEQVEEPGQHGRIYMDVTFIPPPKVNQTPSSKDAIHGSENRVDYAQLDFAKMGSQQTSDSYM